MTAHRPALVDQLAADLGRERQAREAAEAEVARLTAECIRLRHALAAERRRVAPVPVHMEPPKRWEVP